jgi:hypothetical protein
LGRLSSRRPRRVIEPRLDISAHTDIALLHGLYLSQRCRSRSTGIASRRSDDAIEQRDVGIARTGRAGRSTTCRRAVPRKLGRCGGLQAAPRNRHEVVMLVVVAH